jgi:GTPase Era involved in 16S rRNA processing
MKSVVTISNTLKTACQFLDLQEHQQLIKDVESVCEQLVNPNFRIAVLAPFNFGKSTLINALLGQDIMPVKMVRTTGTVIRIKYGKTLTTIITLKSGEIIRSNDTEILKEFAVLNRKGQRREDVSSVEVLYPHFLLKNGVELLDLPGTNDREAQDILVRDQLLQVDLVIQILNARQPFTQGEQDTLNQWLIERGIKTVVFVLNRMNEIETQKDKSEIYDDVVSTIKFFKPDLPNGLKNLYCVDALPALEAKQKNKKWKVFKSGIIDFEVTLLTIISIQKKRTSHTRLLRVITVASKVKYILQELANDLAMEILNAENIRNLAIEKGKQEEKSLKEEFLKRVETYKNWLSSNTLVASYQMDAAKALENQAFYEWQNNKFKSIIFGYTQSIEKCVSKACRKLQKSNSSGVNISFPDPPKISLPSRQDRNAGQWIGDIFNGGANRKKLDQEYENKKWQAYKDAAYSYLSEFSKSTLASINEYEKNIYPLITFSIPPESREVIHKRNDLNSVNSSIDSIRYIKLQKAGINRHKLKILESFKVFMIFWKNYFLHFLR